MEIEKIKFLVIASDGYIFIKNEKYKRVLEKITALNWKRAKKIKEELRKKYPESTIVIKEKFREGWKIISED